jgi:CheY-like chemotaxis protein
MKVLVIDDNPMIQRLYGRSLEAAGVTAVIGSDGSQAVTLATSELPDVILLDVMMPEMNGIEALKQLKTADETKHIPVIMLSANDDALVMQNALQNGAARYLVKSNIEPVDVIAMVEETARNAGLST